MKKKKIKKIILNEKVLDNIILNQLESSTKLEEHYNSDMCRNDRFNCLINQLKNYVITITDSNFNSKTIKEKEKYIEEKVKFLLENNSCFVKSNKINCCLEGTFLKELNPYYFLRKCLK